MYETFINMIFKLKLLFFFIVVYKQYTTTNQSSYHLYYIVDDMAHYYLSPFLLQLWIEPQAFSIVSNLPIRREKLDHITHKVVQTEISGYFAASTFLT